MPRTGTWVLAAGLALLVIGIFSAPKNNGERREHVQTFSLTGITTLDLGDLRIDTITLDWVDDLRLNYTHWGRHGQRVEDKVTADIKGQVLRLSQDQARSWISFNLSVPIWLENFRGDSFSVQAAKPFKRLSLEGQRITWGGGTGDRLEVKLRPEGTGSRCAEITTPEFDFKSGTIKQLHVHAQEGTVILANIDQVDDIELEIGPDVHIQARQRDLSRLRIMLLDVDPVASTMNRLLACQHDTLVEDPDYHP